LRYHGCSEPAEEARAIQEAGGMKRPSKLFAAVAAIAVLCVTTYGGKLCWDYRKAMGACATAPEHWGPHLKIWYRDLGLWVECPAKQISN
jgi:hypothetical protein